ncbi:MAG: UDP-2,3-diacylglucosamine diphosphatase [Salibacteraceae bacterium]
MKPGERIYFASDFHLGVPNREASLERERKIIRWLEMAEKDAAEIFLVGDVFDFWFEYKTVVPRGFVRLLGKIASITDAGIPVHLFTGNHDMWIFDYLPSEIGVQLHRKPITRTFNQQSFYIGHGDGLGPGDHGYKVIKKIFQSPICQWLFARLHPNFGVWLASYSSRRSRIAGMKDDEIFLGEDNEWLVQYCKEVLQSNHYDNFIFGHRHLPLDLPVGDKSRYINLGEWVYHCTYAVFDGQQLTLKKFED